jgi:hypothetical protein
MGVYRAPSGHTVGQPLGTAGNLGTLPAFSTLEHYNGYLVSYSRLSPWVAGMGVHWGHRGPALIVMQNQDGDVTGAEASFPAAQGWHAWFDQPQGKPADTVYSQHLFFTDPASITRTMARSAPSDLGGWSSFRATNAARTIQYRPIQADPTGRATQYGPPAPGIRVLVDAQGHVVGLMDAWPSNSPQGWRPWFDQPQGRPIRDPVLGSVYTQHLWLVDPRSLATS